MRQAFYRRPKPIVFAVLCCLFVALLVVAWWRLPWILETASRKGVSSLGFESVDYSISEADLDHIRIDSLEASDPGWSASVDRIEARFTIGSLWRERKIDALTIGGVHIAVDLEALLAAESESKEEEGETALDLSWLSSIPAKRIELSSGTVSFAKLDEVALQIESGFVDLTTENQGRFDLTIRLDEAEATVSGTLVVDGPSNIEAEAAAPDLIALLERVAPRWRQDFEVPESFRIEAQELQATARVTLDPAARISGDVSVSSGPMKVDYEEARIMFDSTRVTSDFTDELSAKGRIELDISQAAYDDFSLERQLLVVEYESGKAARARVSTLDPIRWSYDENSVSGRAMAVADLEFGQGDEGVSIDAELQAVELDAYEYAITPGALFARGNLDLLEVEFPGFALKEFPSLAITEGTGILDLTDEIATKTQFTATLARDAFSDLIPGLETSAFMIDLSTVSGEVLDTIAVELRREASGEIARFGNDFSVTGDLKARVDLKTDATGERYDGTITIAGKSFSATGKRFSLEDGSLELAETFEQLDFDLLSSDEASIEQRIEHVMSATDGHLELYANRLAFQDVVAQWVTQSADFQGPTESGAAKLSYSATAGIVDVADESIQQLSVAATAAGNLEHVASEGRIEFRYKGTEGILTLEQTVADPLGTLSVEGNYTLQPMQFDYIDAIGTHFPSLAGMTFSGSVSSEGAFWIRGSELDASPLLRLENGSVQYPASQIGVEGIDLVFPLESLLKLDSGAKSAEIGIGMLSAGEIVASDGLFEFRLLDGERVEIEQAEMAVFGGTVALAPSDVGLDPLMYKGRLNFERLSLDAITQQIGFFDGSMSGSISGYLPMVFADGTLRPGEGRLQLPEGETAVLRYNAKGLFTGTEAPEEKSMADKLFKVLEIDPEQMLEEALGNLKISKLDVQIFPPDAPSTPIRIALAGEGMAGDTTVPLNLVTNVNGSLEELYNFLIRLNSLGSASID